MVTQYRRLSEQLSNHIRNTGNLPSIPLLITAPVDDEKAALCLTLFNSKVSKQDYS